MITVVIHARTLQQAISIRNNAIGADAYEWRLDALQSLNLDDVASFLASCPKPCILTLRPRRQGGHWSGTEPQRIEWLKKLLVLKPNYLDVEYDLPPGTISELAKLATPTQLIVSSHQPNNPTQDLALHLNQLAMLPCQQLKIAIRANNAIECIQILAFAKQRTQSHPLTVITLGPGHAWARVIGAIIGNRFHYCHPDGQPSVAPGQLSLSAMKQQFRVDNLNGRTRCYALLGDPVAHSIGDQWHNDYFAKHHDNAVYVKIRLSPAQLPAFLKLAHQLPFHGFSVTMPLKQLAYQAAQTLSPIAKKIQAVNTLIRKPYGWHGCNTDGLGALIALRRHWHNVVQQRILILGAGGAARAIIYQLQSAGAIITLANRTDARAKQLAMKFNCSTVDWHERSQAQYDLIVNTTPTPIDWLTSCHIMDISYRHDRQKNAIPGQAMFHYQAQAQQRLWQNQHHQNKS